MPSESPSTPQFFPTKTLKVFLSYSHSDNAMRVKLEKYLSNLKRQKTIISWYDGEIGAGNDWDQEIDKQLSQANIVLLLISQDFIASDYCYNKEMMRSLERHRRGEACVIPIILRPAHWEVTPLRELQALPTGGKPITCWSNRDKAFLDVARGIQKIVDRLTGNNSTMPLDPVAPDPVHPDPLPPDPAISIIPVILSNSDKKTLPLPPEQEEVVNPSVSVLSSKLPTGEPPVNLPPRSNPAKTTRDLPPEQKVEINPSIAPPDEPVSPGDPSRPPFNYKILRRRAYVALASIIVVPLIFGSIFSLPLLLRKPSPELFPALCNGNFQSANVATVPTPATSTSPDGEPIGLSEGANIFDLHRPNEQEVQYKLQAAQATTNDPQIVVSLLNDAIRTDQTDAEAQIYLENWKVLNSKHPYITLVVGVSFAFSSAGGSRVDDAGTSRGALQGAFTAQKECNEQNKQNNAKTQIVLMIANVGGNRSSKSAEFVADQIVDQASKDPTIVGIMGWLYSADSLNVNHQLKKRNSHLPMVSPSSSTDELEGRSNFFRVGHKNRELASVAADFVLNTKQKKRIAILYDQTTSYGNTLKDDFAKDLPNNMAGSPASFTRGDSKAVQDALTNVLAQNPDAIFFAGYESDLFNLLDFISSTSFANLLIVSAPALSTTNNITNPLPDLHNVYFPTSATPKAWEGTNPQPPLFRDYPTYFGTLTASTGLPSIDSDVMGGYDALLTLLHGTQQVLSRQSTITPSDLTGELKKITSTNPIQGVTGRIAFDSNGDQDTSKIIFMEHIKGNKLVIDEKHGCLLVTGTCYK
jgi:ABC-type branched-subunit amino acid transport system substrate-binding protein